MQFCCKSVAGLSGKLLLELSIIKFVKQESIITEKEVNSMKNKKRIALAVTIALIFGTCITGCSSEKSSDKKHDVSQTESGAVQKSKLGELKSFEAKTLEGKDFTQDDIAKKDVTVINFWSVYCGPCVDEMPDIAKFSKSLPDNVQVITVNLDGEQEQSFTEQILKESGFEGITLVNGTGDIGKVSDAIQYTPTTIVVDKDGNIIGDAIIGGQENLAEVFTSAINDALKSMGKAEISNAES